MERDEQFQQGLERLRVSLGKLAETIKVYQQKAQKTFDPLMAAVAGAPKMHQVRDNEGAVLQSWVTAGLNGRSN